MPSTSTDAFWRITNTQRRQSIQRRQAAAKASAARAAELSGQGHGEHEIGRRLGVHHLTVRRWLRRAK